MKKILYLAHDRKIGGAALCLFSMAEEMKSRGHKVAVVLPFYFSPVAKELRNRGIKTYWVFYGWWMIPTWSMLLKLAFHCVYAIEWVSVLCIGLIAKLGGYQIIHSNSSVIDVGSKAAKIAGCTHIWHFREFGDLYFRLSFIRGREKAINNIKKSKDILVFVSEALRNHYRELIKTNSTYVIYDGVNDEYLNYHTHKNEKLIFLSSGTLHRGKGQFTIMKAAKFLKTSGYRNFEVWIAGTVTSLQESKLYKKELDSYISENQLDEIKLLGHISNMVKLREKSDIEIVASKMEAFGRVTVEAMLSGNPVIAANSGANIELVKDDFNGWLFETDDEVSLAEKMKTAIDNHKNLDKMGKNAYDFAKERFLSKMNTKKIEELYFLP